jgi:hypothetical protein
MTEKPKKPEAKIHLSVEDVTARVEEIENISGDSEVAHSREGDLWRDVLRAIAEGAPDAAALAREALKTEDLSFARGYA